MWRPVGAGLDFTVRRRPVLIATLGFSKLHPGDVIDGFLLMERLHVGGATSGPVAAQIAARAPCGVTLARWRGRAGLTPVGDKVETEPDSGFGVEISCVGIDARRHRR